MEALGIDGLLAPLNCGRLVAFKTIWMGTNAQSLLGRTGLLVIIMIILVKITILVSLFWLLLFLLFFQAGFATQQYESSEYAGS